MCAYVGFVSKTCDCCFVYRMNVLLLREREKLKFQHYFRCKQKNIWHLLQSIA